MKFDPPLQTARLIRRYKRFLADVQLPSGHETTLHCPNTGSMRGCAEPGSRVWYSDSANPKRKYPCSWELVEVQGRYLACINTQRANGLVEEALLAGILPELAGYPRLRREVGYGRENSRIDLLLEGDSERCFVEVKNVTLLEDDGIGYFPDAVTVRGAKHLRELVAAVASGDRAALVFCVAHTGICEVRPADHLDPAYGQALRAAVKAGVELYALGAHIDPVGIALQQRLPVVI
ncbi:DNA/RNA nuclease SfsA [Motiliproteus sediminis]|uniref:DNA/RNA nuclease SfsA n=1 Tax=Motiliproteus sediminis TaxID=1468178 RepID=UPI001AEF92BF|nr:DNA/RNA nuclease SfsA [Motiliproteus sediminis]